MNRVLLESQAGYLGTQSVFRQFGLIQFGLHFVELQGWCHRHGTVTRTMAEPTLL